MLGRRTLLALAAAACCLGGCGQGTEAPELGPQTLRRAGGARAQWGAPAGRYEGEAPRAVLMLIHGGGWKGADRQAFNAQKPIAVAYRRLGFATINVDYRAGAAGVADVDRFYREARRRVGPHVPICALGGSAGGHIALMLAVRHPDLACVISIAGPTDLVALKSARGGAGYRLAVTRFGRNRLVAYSPARHGSSIRAALLLIYAANDKLVPPSQGRLMARAARDAKLMVLPPGSVPFGHGSVAAAARAGVPQAELAFLNRAAAAR